MRALIIASIALMAASCQATKSQPEIRSLWNCTATDLQQSWEEIGDHIPDATGAQKLANAILCLPRTKDTNDFINSHLDDAIETSSYGTGDIEEEHDTLSASRSKDRFGGHGGSPDLTFHAHLNEKGDIELDAANEACIDTTVLRHREKVGWVISEFHSACD